MLEIDPDQLLSRERLAHYDTAVLQDAAIALGGCGAAANNIAQTLALSGVRTQVVVDFDTVESSNLTRSPLFARARLRTGQPRFKAHELGLGVLAMSYAQDPVVHVATKRVQALGLGAFRDVQVIVSAVDSLPARAYLSDVASVLGKPFVEVGFILPRGHVSVFPHRDPDDACWRCAHPDVKGGGVSCEDLAALAVAAGYTPATQSLAAVTGALAAEAVIGLLHGRAPLANCTFQVDIRTGRSVRVEITRDPHCAGPHRRLGVAVDVPVTVDQPATALFEALAGEFAEPILQLPAPVLIEAPCMHCGRPVRLVQPAWALLTPPACRQCPDAPYLDPAAPVVAETLTADDPIARLSCRKLGLAAGTLVEVYDRPTSTLRVLRLAGGPADLFTTLRRPERHATPPADMNPGATTTPARPTSEEDSNG